MEQQFAGLVFENHAFKGHEQVIFCHDGSAGLRAIIAIHSTVLGPAMGGARMWSYESEAEALRDALRLSRGMTYKNALAGLDFGGAKAVIIGDPYRQKTPSLLRAFARQVHILSGRFITGEDVGITAADIDEMRQVTPHVRGSSKGPAGDPSPHTASGVYEGMAAALAYRSGEAGFAGRTICIQGLGKVGWALAELLHEAGAKLTVADLRGGVVREAVNRFGAAVAAPQEAHKAPADVFAPCALGGVLNAGTIPEIRAGIVAGSANNQLHDDAAGWRLMQRGILYAPDYVINAGGAIAIAHEGPDFDYQRMRRHVASIGATLKGIFERAAREGVPPPVIAGQMAEERLSQPPHKRAA